MVFQGIEQHQTDHDLVSMVAKTHAVRPFVTFEIPGVAGQAVIARHHLEQVGIADALSPLQVAPVVRHGGQPHQDLENVAVQLRPGTGQVAEIGGDRGMLHDGGRHIGHPMEPGRASQQFRDGQQTVFGVLGGAEQTQRPSVPFFKSRLPGMSSTTFVYRISFRSISRRRPS